MNNIEIGKLKNLKPGMTSTEINKLKIKIDKPLSDKGVKKIKKEVKEAKKVLDFLYKLNLVKDLHDARDYKFTELTFNQQGTTPHNSIDWTNTMSPVKDQGRLGSCVAFATAAMKEWQEQKEHDKEVKEGKLYKRNKKNYDLSEQWIYYNCKKIDPWPNEEGTSIRFAMHVLNKIGVPCEEGWKYNDSVKGKPESWSKMVSKWNLIDSYYRLRGIDDLRMALENGPVVIGIYCFREIFYVGVDGIIPYPKNPKEIYGGHAVCAVGFDDSKKLIKFKNSWSSSWGKKGYGYLPYSYINNFLLDAWAAKDLQVTREIFKKNIDNEL